MKYNDASKLLLVCLCSLLLVACAPQAESLTILHTNDTHSQVEPIAAGKRDAFHAGYARRMGIIQQERALDPNLILVDAGDFCQGTPYFNFYHGRIEIDAMNRMDYDAITLGNHEFDNGVDTLAAVLRNAQFPIVCANYNVQGSPLEGIVQPYTIITRAGIRVGILGVGINPEGLIAAKNFAPVQYLDPFISAQEAATELKMRHHCDVIICLSHLGTHTDEKLAEQSKYIDVIVGGHTHKIITNRYVENTEGKSVLLTQMGKSGARIGKIMLKIGE